MLRVEAEHRDVLEECLAEVLGCGLQIAVFIVESVAPNDLLGGHTLDLLDVDLAEQIAQRCREPEETLQHDVLA